MSSLITITEVPEGKKVTLSDAPLRRPRILHMGYAGLYLASAYFFSRLLESEWEYYLLLNLFVLVVTVGFFLLFVRYFNKATEKEFLLINKDRLILMRESVLSRKLRTFKVAGISGLRFLEEEKSTPHPLSGETFDYLGFQGQQIVIDNLYQEGRVAFDYEGRTIRFGKELYSWHFNEIEALLFECTGKDLRVKQSAESWFPLPEESINNEHHE